MGGGETNSVVVCGASRWRRGDRFEQRNRPSRDTMPAMTTKTKAPLAVADHITLLAQMWDQVAAHVPPTWTCTGVRTHSEGMCIDLKGSAANHATDERTGYVVTLRVDNRGIWHFGVSSGAPRSEHLGTVEIPSDIEPGPWIANMFHQLTL